MSINSFSIIYNSSASCILPFPPPEESVFSSLHILFLQQIFIELADQVLCWELENKQEGESSHPEDPTGEN